MLLALGRAVAVAACSAVVAGRGALPSSALSVRANDGWRVFWNSESAPVSFDTSRAALSKLVTWHRGMRSVEWSDLELAGTGEAWRTRLIVARIDPSRATIELDTAFSGTRAAWRVDRARAGVALAVNAGQFVQSMPWGWVMLDGHQFLPPGEGPLATTVSFSYDGGVHFTHGSTPPAHGVRWAFQSYPTILANGDVPEPLRQAGCGVDVGHRDARLAIGVDARGRLLIAMTRFDAFGVALSSVPFGVTTPEMAAVMGSLGARDAVLLDGGISAQMVFHDASGALHRWPGIRAVPLALIVR